MDRMTRPISYRWIALSAWLLLGTCSQAATALEHVLANIDGQPRKLSGKVVVEDSVGSMLLETDDGALWPIHVDFISTRSKDDKPLKLLDKDELAQRLLSELGPDFQVHDSKHYVVVYNTTRTYAKWCSSLLERLQKGFLAYWKKRGCDVHEPKAPLAVLVFSDRDSYLRYAKKELGPGGTNAIGYYSFQTNRIAMYDLTGMQELRRQNTKRGRLSDITALLNQPSAEPLVATIVHEATHQISFNCGMQTRYADNPVWLSEGLAVFFETPDLSSSRSWSGIGKVNYSRWDLFRKNFSNGKVPLLKDLIATDDRIRNPGTAVDAYAEAWAWNYFLITWHTEEYAAYLKTLSAKPQLVQDDPETRLADFRRHFGNDLDELQKEFLRRMSRLK